MSQSFLLEVLGFRSKAYTQDLFLLEVRLCSMFTTAVSAMASSVLAFASPLNLELS